jgi:DNA-binding transcriptional LysR family regulator
MELTVWRTFVTVCRLGSLSAAATELGYTQSAVSRQIAGLERQLGVPLVQRHVRGVRPTPAGEVFRHHAQATLNDADRAVRAARDVRDGAVSRPLAIGATPSLAAGIVPAAIRRLLEEAAPLRWSLVPGLSPELHDRVIAGDLDVAVVTDAPPGLPHDPRVERRFLGMDDMAVVLPIDHPRAGHGPVHIQTLADQTWVEDNDGSAARRPRRSHRPRRPHCGRSARQDGPGRNRPRHRAHTRCADVCTADGPHHSGPHRSPDPGHLHDHTASRPTPIRSVPARPTRDSLRPTSSHPRRTPAG